MNKNNQEDRHRFSLTEFSGSLGDLGLFIPLTVAMAVASNIDFGMILITAGVMNIATGIAFRQPVPVQPMKAIAAIAITEGLTRGEIMSSGILMGVILVVLAYSGMVEKISVNIPKSIVRGIQFGIGAKLIIDGLKRVFELDLTGPDSIVVALIVSLVIVFRNRMKIPVLLVLFMAGFFIIDSATRSGFAFGLPKFAFIFPETQEWISGFTRVTLPQLPLTLLNSVVAVCALSGQYYPGRGINPTKMASSVGLMNLFCAPLGGIPMCHGAGGLAAQYGFGARTGGSVIMLGAMKVIAGLIFGASLMLLLKVYPQSILGPMLIFAGYELAQTSKDMTKFGDILVVLCLMASTVFLNTLYGFLIGCGVYIIVAGIRKIGVKI